MTSTLGGERTGAGGALAATPLAVVAGRLCEGADLRAGWRVLVVGPGCAVGVLAAARLGCAATGIDPGPLGDAAALPFADASFDAVLSLFPAADGATAGELLRVAKPGGTIAVTAWASAGVPPDASAARRPANDLLGLLRDGVASLELTERTVTFRAGVTAAYVEAVALRR